jgi:hypothetical protein
MAAQVRMIAIISEKEERAKMTRGINIARKLSIVLMALGATFASALTAFAASNTSGLVLINLAGVGTGALAAGSCASPAIGCALGHTCACLAGVETVIGSPAQGFSGGSFTFELSIDQTSSPLPVSTVGDCLPATGFATLRNSKGTVTVTFDVTGLSCPSVDGRANVFNGSYWVTGGSGTLTTGTGALNGSLAATVARISLNGNLQ